MQTHTTEDDLSWTQTEATAEYLSSGDTDEDGLEKAIWYTADHLLSRPDRVVVPGFYFGPKIFNLIFTGVSGTCHTRLQWTNRDHIKLLCEFVHRIFKPSPEMVDPNIVRVLAPHTVQRSGRDFFDVTLKTKTYFGCEIMSLGNPMGRRTTIFETDDPKVPVIKEQYLVTPSVEFEILEVVSKIPGVVRLEDYDEYRPNSEGKMVVGCTIGEESRYKVRLALRDKGEPIMESKTVEQFLIRLYDMLEVAECLYVLGYLHRDYSLHNVLFREPKVGEEPEYRKEWEESNFCSAKYLLGKGENRFETEVLVIDFELATKHETQEKLESAGTPMYQARAAAKVAPLKVRALTTGMPGVAPGLLERYSKALPERGKKFIVDGTFHIFDPREGDTEEWYHELRHDVESAFWMLLHWAVIFQPAGGKQLPIPKTFFDSLTDEDWRGSLVFGVQYRSDHWVHPDIKGVQSLIKKMAEHLEGELQWLDPNDQHYEQMKKASYLREVFQRLILNFLFEHQGKDFMRKERHKSNRPKQVRPDRQVCLRAKEIKLRQLMGPSSLRRRCDEEERRGVA